MMAAGLVSGACLFTLLIVDTYCAPFKGSKPGASYGGSYTKAAPNFDSYYGAQSGQTSHGVVSSNAPAGVSTSSYHPVPQIEPSYTQLAVKQPALPAGSTSSGRVGYSASPAGQTPASSPQTAYPREVDWAVPPPSFLSGDESTDPRGVGPQILENVSPPLPPPGPMYQAGELSHYEQNFEDGNYETETEEQGYLPSPPLPEVSAGPEYTIKPPPPPPRMWHPFPYYDYMFLTGQYPPGTVTHSSSDFEQGRDGWQEAHYVRYYAPYEPEPVEQIETFPADFQASQSYEAPQQPVKTPVMAPYGKGGAGYGQGEARPLQTASGNFRQPHHSQAGGYGMIKYK